MVEDNCDSCGPVNFAILRIAKLHKNLAAELLAELGLYPGQEFVLMTLSESGPLEQRELIRRTGTHASTVTKMVQRLERGGFVQRDRSPDDARSMIVALTPDGERMIGRLYELWRQLEDLTMAGLTPHQRTTLPPMLEKLERSITAAICARHEHQPGNAR